MRKSKIKSKNVKRVLLLILFVSLAVVLFAQEKFADCARKPFLIFDSTSGQQTFSRKAWYDCVMGKHIPEISFKTIAGNKFSTGEMKGKVTVINFWCIGCAPCLAELPALNLLVQEYKNNDVLFFGITYHSAKELKAKFFSKYKFDFQIVAGAKDIADEFAFGYPTTYVIDSNGIVKAAWNGGPLGEEAKAEIFLKAKPVIDGLLAK